MKRVISTKAIQPLNVICLEGRPQGKSLLLLSYYAPLSSFPSHGFCPAYVAAYNIAMQFAGAKYETKEG